MERLSSSTINVNPAVGMEIPCGPCFSLCGVTRPFVAHPEPRTLCPERVDPRSLRLGFLIIQIDVLCSAPLRHASPAVGLLKKSVFNLGVDAMQPLLRPVGFLAISIDFCFQLRDAIFGRSQLM